MSYTLGESDGDVRALLETLRGKHGHSRNARIGGTFLGLLLAGFPLWVAALDSDDRAAWSAMVLAGIAIGGALVLSTNRRYEIDPGGIASRVLVPLFSWRIDAGEIRRIALESGQSEWVMIVTTADRKRRVELTPSMQTALERLHPGLFE